MPIGMLRSICRISVGASAWNTIFRQNRSIIITGVAAEIGGMWALRWRSPEPRDEACAISVIITDVIRVRAGGRILIELGIGPESSYCAPFYDRVHCHSDYWHEHYDSYCKRHGKYHPHKHGYKKHPKYGKRKYGRYHDDDYDDDEDDDD